MASEIAQAVKQITEEKNIPLESVIETIEAALAAAYRKDFGEKNQNIKVEFDLDSGSSTIFDVKEVVEDELFEEYEKEREARAAAGEDADAPSEAPHRKPAQEETQEEEERKFNPKTMVALKESGEIKKGAKVGDEVRTELIPPEGYGRMAAQTAKQVIIQKLREAEREIIYEEFKDKEGEVIGGLVQRVEGKLVLVDMGNVTAIMPPQEQVPSERYTSGARYKVYVSSVNQTPKGPEIVVSRTSPEIVRRLFELEVPEISAGTVELKAIAREAGSRTKIAVASTEDNIDPIGSCVGQRGIRVQTVINELGGEKIDIVEWEEDPIKFIVHSLSPAKVMSVELNEEHKHAKAFVKEDQLSLAIGKAGQNVRLAAKLTGWKIDIVEDGSGGVKGGDPPSPEATEDEAKDKETSESPEDKKEDKKDEEKSEKESKDTEVKEEETAEPKEKEEPKDAESTEVEEKSDEESEKTKDKEESKKD